MSVRTSVAGDGEQRMTRGVAELFAPRGHYVWRGSSGRAFTHTVYSLIGCPPPLAASWVLVRLEADGRRIALATGHTRCATASHNLAEIRHRGATLEANEVHLYPAGESTPEGVQVAFDIGAAEGLR